MALFGMTAKDWKDVAASKVDKTQQDRDTADEATNRK